MKSRAKKRITQNIFLLLMIFLPGIIIFSRCANQGMPTGGPRDSIPPKLLETLPAMRALNFKDKEVRITFDEYVLSDAVPEELIVSPPLTKRPSIRTKSRTLIVAFNEDLKPDVTYSMDFKNSVVDNNEKNPYRGLRLIFSTGSQIDTLRIAGVVKSADKLEPQEKFIVALYSNLNDTAVTRTKPDYISRTDPRGIFLFDNVKPAKYHLYAFKDANSNLQYDQGAEEFAFCDSVIVPSAQFEAKPDTSAIGADSLLITGHTIFKPDPIYLRTFTEKLYDQFLNKSSRESRYKCILTFGESVKDTFHLRLLNQKAENWYQLEYNPRMDSLTVWVTDTLTAKMDTLKLEVAYFKLDSMKQKFMKHDTLQMVYTEKERADVKKKKKEKENPEEIQFNLSNNIKSSGFDLNCPILITAPEPVKSFDYSMIKLTKAEDLTSAPLKFTIKKDSVAWRTYRFDYPWEPNTEYQLEVDSMACTNIYGITSRKIKQKFTTQKEDYYGKIILHLTSVKNNLIVQLLDNNKDENVLKTAKTNKDGKITFDFLAPAKYKVRIIFDDNNNGKWDTGNFEHKIQPERVAYLPEIVKVRSNWEKQFEWELKPDPTLKKRLIDKEEEELQLKKSKEQQQQKEKTKGKKSTKEGFGKNIGKSGTF